MAREFSGPLSAEDLEYLRTRHPAAYVDRMVTLYGTADADEAPEGTDEGDESGEQGSGEGQTQPEGSEAPEDAESGSEDDETDTEDDGDDADEDSDPDTGDEDLIGTASETSYNPLDHTTNEVRKHLKSVTPEEAERIKAVEAARDDREPRTSITNFNPS